MSEQNHANGANHRAHPYTVRDFMAVYFRHQRLILLSFGGLMLGAVLAICLLPANYEAQMKFMLMHQRVDPIVAAQSNVQQEEQALTPAEVSSEVELIQSRDILRQVVVALRMYAPKDPWSWGAVKLRILGVLGMAPDKETRIYQAVLDLEKNLQVIPMIDSNLIQVTYDSGYPDAAAQVLHKLGEFYIAKHVAVHRPQGASVFFEEASQEYGHKLAAAQARLIDFSRRNGTVMPAMEEQITLQKLGEFEGSLHQTRADIQETKHRIKTLKEQLTSMSARNVSQIHTGINPQLLQSLKATLLTLELKRIELLEQYKPDYQPVQEVEKQIAAARASIESAEEASVLDKTTDLNPTYQLIVGDLIKSQADLSGLQARESAMSRTVAEYRRKGIWLDQQDIAQQNLVLAAKNATDNYTLYMAKMEQAQLTDALDQKRIMNVAIAEAAAVPLVPTGLGPLAKLIVALLLAALFSIGMAFIAEHLNQSLRTPDEVENLLELPVLAAMPKNGF